jgi:hypothetical protein
MFSPSKPLSYGTVILNERYIPVIIQDACFSVLERFQFKATLCNKGYSLIKSGNNEVILLKRFTHFEW